MPDGYPIVSSEPDFPVQMRISEDLQNADRVQAAFDERRTQAAGNFTPRQRAFPTPTELFPGLSGARAEEWLEPMLRRMRWQTERGEAVRKCRDRLADMVVVSMGEMGRPSEAHFAMLAEHADCFAMPAAFRYLDGMMAFVRMAERGGPLGPGFARALRAVFAHARRIHVATYGWEWFVWPLFRSEGGFAGADWAEVVRRDLGSFEEELRALWLPVFDAERRQLGGAGEPAKACLAAVERLGKERLEWGLRRWIGLLKDGAQTRLSAEGTVVFRHTLLLCERLGGQGCDNLLYEVACAPWRRGEDIGWMSTYLWILGRRPADCAFACLEALAMNPATATDEVQRDYQAALEKFEREGRRTGIDGYPWDREPALETHQRRIEGLLQMSAAAVDRGSPVDPSAALHRKAIEAIPEAERTPATKIWLAQMTAQRPWFDPGPDTRVSLEATEKAILEEFGGDAAGLYRAALNRWLWIREHQREFSPELMKAWRQCFWGLGCGGGLLRKSLQKADGLPLGELLRAVENAPGNWKIFELCRDYVAAHGWTVELAAGFREWIGTLETSATGNEYRAKAEWLLWFEDVLPLKPERCWGERVRQDLRGMRPAERKAWVELFEQGSFRITDEPTKKWLKPAETAFPKIGAAVFRKRFTAWFAPFAASEPLRLTVTGRNVLRLLMWAALIAKDPAVDRALAGFAQAQWKTKDSAQRAGQAEMAFSYVLAQRAPATALPILEEMVRSGRAPAGSATYRNYQGLLAH